MGVSKIEELIDQFNEYVDECKPVMLSKTNISIPRDVLQDFLDQLRLSTPDEIKRYQKLVNNRDAIIQQAETKAAGIIKAAEEKAEALVSENDIFQRACAKANEIVADAGMRAENMVNEATNEADRILYEANKESNSIRSGALGYANELLSEVESAISGAFESINAKSNMLVSSLKANLDVVVRDRQELNGEIAPAQPVEQYTEKSLLDDANDADIEAAEDEIIEGFDENTFLEEDEGESF